MSNKMNEIFQKMTPYLIIGIVIAMLVGLLIMFSYLFLWGILIGAILWLVAVIKSYFFPSKPSSENDGRIIEHNDKK